jgi:hypothetical protein
MVMNTLILRYPLLYIFFLVLSIFFHSTSFAGRAGGGIGGGGLHQNEGVQHKDIGNHNNNLYHEDDEYVGTYHNNNDVGTPVVITPDVEVTTNCQTVQQCDSEGTCIENQECN